MTDPSTKTPKRSPRTIASAGKTPKKAKIDVEQHVVETNTRIDATLLIQAVRRIGFAQHVTGKAGKQLAITESSLSFDILTASSEKNTASIALQDIVKVTLGRAEDTMGNFAGYYLSCSCAATIESSAEDSLGTDLYIYVASKEEAQTILSVLEGHRENLVTSENSSVMPSSSAQKSSSRQSVMRSSPPQGAYSGPEVASRELVRVKKEYPADDLYACLHDGLMYVHESIYQAGKDLSSTKKRLNHQLWQEVVKHTASSAKEADDQAVRLVDMLEDSQQYLRDFLAMLDTADQTCKKSLAAIQQHKQRHQDKCTKVASLPKPCM